MQKFAWVLIGLSVLGFIFAVIGSMTTFKMLGVWPEAYSRGGANLTLIAIALLLIPPKKSGA
jgi:hypothetical protein